ncbi:hypothetical protein ACLSZ7_08235 [Avibacterium gallinarum]|uniref:hypothetical protein n=1 Tax=Avibacterium gallinarum TaxID=755 RepID=UPI003BF7DF99
MIEKELTILNKIYDIIYNGCTKNFDSFEYIYKINKIENWESMRVVYLENGNIISQNDFEYINEESLEYLTKELHIIMFNRTGGEWTKMTLSFMNNQVNTKFSYENQSILT